MVRINLNVDDHGSFSEFEPLPNGEYILCMVSHEKKPSKSNPKNEYLSCGFKVMDGELAGRMVFDKFHLWHTGDKCRQIAWDRLSDMARAIGIPKADDCCELYNMNFLGKVKVTSFTADDGTEIKGNEITSFKEKPSALSDYKNQAKESQTCQADASKGQASWKS